MTFDSCEDEQSAGLPGGTRQKNGFPPGEKTGLFSNALRPTLISGLRHSESPQRRKARRGCEQNNLLIPKKNPGTKVPKETQKSRLNQASLPTLCPTVSPLRPRPGPRQFEPEQNDLDVSRGVPILRIRAAGRSRVRSPDRLSPAGPQGASEDSNDARQTMRASAHHMPESPAQREGISVHTGPLDSEVAFDTLWYFSYFHAHLACVLNSIHPLP